MRGIHQGSVLSPLLFLVVYVIDPLLQQLEKSALRSRPSINNLYVGGYLPAVDIRALASSLDVLDAQDSSACPYVNRHLPGEAPRQLEHLNFQTLFQ